MYCRARHQLDWNFGIVVRNSTIERLQYNSKDGPSRLQEIFLRFSTTEYADNVRQSEDRGNFLRRGFSCNFFRLQMGNAALSTHCDAMRVEEPRFEVKG